MNQLTFLLTLKDRADFTPLWLRHNLNPLYDYVIADGSIGNENEILFSSLNLPNLKYKRFPEDVAIAQYVEKVLSAINEIDTPYMMMVDNDDFINFYGIPYCIRALEEDSAAVSAGGLLIGVSQTPRSRVSGTFSLPFGIVASSAKLSQKSGFDAIQQLFKNYSHMWYGVFRTDVNKKIWRDIAKLEVLDVFLIELLQAELTFCHGKYIEVTANHYVRLTNPSSSVASNSTKTDIPHIHKIYFDEKYRAQALKMSAHVADLLNVDVKEFLDHFKFFYIGKRMLPKIHGILSLQFRSRIVTFLPHFRIERIMALVNFFHRGGRS